MKKLVKRDDESIAEFCSRLRKKFNSPEWQAKRREENLFMEWRYGKAPKPKKTPGAKFHSPQRYSKKEK